MKTNRGEEQIDLLELLYLCWHNAVKIIIAMLVCAVIGYFVTEFGIPKTYSANVDMIVNNQVLTANTSSNSKKKDSATTSVSQDLQSSSSLANTYAVILKSHVVLEQVIHNLDLPYDYNGLADQISVESVDGTPVMRLTVQDSDPDRAMKIAEEMVDLAPKAIMDTIDVGSVKTVDEPWTTGQPIAPNKKRNTMLAGLVGLVGSVGVLLLKMMLNNRFRTEADVKEVLDLPILATIPMEKDS